MLSPYLILVSVQMPTISAASSGFGVGSGVGVGTSVGSGVGTSVGTAVGSGVGCNASTIFLPMHAVIDSSITSASASDRILLMGNLFLSGISAVSD